MRKHESGCRAVKVAKFSKLRYDCIHPKQPCAEIIQQTDGPDFWHATSGEAPERGLLFLFARMDSLFAVVAEVQMFADPAFFWTCIARWQPTGREDVPELRDC